MTIHDLNVQQRQHGHGSPSENTEGVGIYSGYVPNTNTLQVRCAGMFTAIKEYVWPTQTDTTVHALTGRAIDVEKAGECNPEQDHPEQGNRYISTIKCVVLAAAAAGLAATAWWVGSTFCADGNAEKPNGVTPDAVSAALATTALIGRRLLSSPTVTNAIANQSVYANAPFNLQVDLTQVFSYSGSLADIHFSQADGTPLPGWLTTSIITPVLVGSIGTGNGVSVVGNYAYMTYDYGLIIIDVSNKTRPIHVGTAATTYGSRVTVVGNYAYVTDSVYGLNIINVTNKASPSLVGSIETMTASDVDVVGNYAYVTAGCLGLKIIDISNKANPILVGRAAITGNAGGVTVVGNYTYVADRNVGLKIIDVTNKARPFAVGSVAMQYAEDVAVVGNYAYVADYSRLRIIDVSNKANPTVVGSATTTGAQGITVVGNYAYVADWTDGLKIFDVSNKANPILFGSAAMTGLANSVTVVGNYAYVLDNCGGINIFSSDKTSLSGTPSSLNRGIVPIKLTITDTLGETASAYFWITVLNNPPTSPTIAPQVVHRSFNWTISSFTDSDGDTLTYSATLPDGSPLPGWVSFNPTTRTLSGVVPPVVTVRNINIQAHDSYGGIANATQMITIVNNSPIIGPGVLPGQNVKSTVPFSFSLDPDDFTDPDGDSLTYGAALTSQQPLPNWLTFNQTSEMFTGTAPARSTGLISVIVTVTDPFGATVARSFDLNVAASNANNNLPQKVQNPPDYSVGLNKGISFQISNNTFFDADNDPLIWSASAVNGSALPVWLNFVGDNRFFYGIAPGTPQILPITLQAEDWQHIPATANFNLLVEGGPQLLEPLSNLVATVGTPFKFAVPKNTFQDLGIQDAMIFSAALTTDAPLPAWLIFDPVTRTFTGTPSRKDTNAFSSRSLPIRLMANNNFGTASTDFILNVQGESDATLAIKIISGLSAALLIGAAGVKRKSIWKKSMKCVFRLPTEHVIITDASKYCHSITRLNRDQVASVQLLRDGQSLPGGILLPDWLIYAPNAKITIDAVALQDQDGLTISRWTVQVKNKGGCVNGLVWEEFDLKFVHQLSDANVDGESRDTYNSIAMKPPKSHHKQLRQPLIA